MALIRAHGEDLMAHITDGKEAWSFLQLHAAAMLVVHSLIVTAFAVNFVVMFMF